MGFIQSADEINKRVNNAKSFDFFDAKMAFVFFKTDPDAIKKLLPPPLKPLKQPMASVFIAEYPKTSFGAVYKEAALFLQAEYNGQPGAYCLSMPVDDDMALILGRETFGFPKKIADITFKHEDRKFEGSVVRHGHEILKMDMELALGEFPIEATALGSNATGNPGESMASSYLFKYFFSPVAGELDYPPRLIRQFTLVRPKKLERGRAEIKFSSSPHDPWGEIPIVEINLAFMGVFNNSMVEGEVLAEVDTKDFMPYAFSKLDAGI